MRGDIAPLSDAAGSCELGSLWAVCVEQQVSTARGQGQFHGNFTKQTSNDAHLACNDDIRTC